MKDLNDPNIYIFAAFIIVFSPPLIYLLGVSWSPKWSWGITWFNAEHFIIEQKISGCHYFTVESKFLGFRHGWYYGMDEEFHFRSREEAESWIVEHLNVRSLKFELQSTSR